MVEIIGFRLPTEPYMTIFCHTALTQKLQLLSAVALPSTFQVIGKYRKGAFKWFRFLRESAVPSAALNSSRFRRYNNQSRSQAPNICWSPSTSNCSEEVNLILWEV